MRTTFIHLGVVSKTEKGMVSVIFPDDRVSAPIPLLQYASAGVRVASPIKPGDPVVVLAPDGNPDNGFAMRGIFTETVALPEESESKTVVSFEDGTTISVDNEGQSLGLTHSSGLEAIVSDGKITILGDLEVDGNITSTSGDVSAAAGVRKRVGAAKRQ